MIKDQSEKVVAIAYSDFFIPRGKICLNGTKKDSGEDCFSSLYDLGTYIADWIDLIGDETKVSATIYLNVLSLKKVFKGKEIISVIDKIEKNSNYKSIRNFSELS